MLLYKLHGHEIRGDWLCLHFQWRGNNSLGTVPEERGGGTRPECFLFSFNVFLTLSNGSQLQVWIAFPLPRLSCRGGRRSGEYPKGLGGFWRSGIHLWALSGGKCSWSEGPKVLSPSLCLREGCKGREISSKNVI